MKKSFFLLFFILFSINAHSCLNGETEVLTNRRIIYRDPVDRFAPKGHEFKGVDEKLAQELDSLYRKTKNISYLSDKGYVLIVLGKYAEAIRLYLTIEKIKPNMYSTASNIGTAYELLGENENALKWIKKATGLNSKSHKGSEWIHIKILEAKIKGGTFTDTYLLNDFGKGTYPTSALPIDSLMALRAQLSYQLNERMSFVKPKDKIVAMLLFELGNVCYLVNPERKKGDLEDGDEALKNFNNAIKYGFSNPIINLRLAIAKGKKALSKPMDQIKPNPNRSVYWASSLAIILVLSFLMIRNRKIRN